MKLLSTVKSSRWKNSFLVHFYVCLSAAGVCVCHAVTLVHIPYVSVIVLYYCRFQSISMLIMEIALCWWMEHVHMFTCLLSFQIMVVKLPLTLVLISHRFSTMPFWLSLTVLHQFIFLLCKLSNRLRGEKVVHIDLVPYTFNSPRKTCHSSMCCCHVSVAYILSLPEYTLMSYVYPLESQSVLCFLGIYCLKTTLPLKSTMISSTAKCSD